MDYETNGCILDDGLFKMLVAPLPEGVRLTCVFDCCHSASMLDLPFGFVSNKSAGEVGNATTHVMEKLRHNNFARGDVVMISGCEDSQTSADVQNVTSFGDGEPGAGGAATQAFTWALMNTTGLDYLNILLKTRDMLKEKGFTQVPQLSSSKPVDLDKPFSLFGTVTTNEEQLQQHVPAEFRCLPPPPQGCRRGGPRQGFVHGPMTQLRRGGLFVSPPRGGMWGCGPGMRGGPMIMGEEDNYAYNNSNYNVGRGFGRGRGGGLMMMGGGRGFGCGRGGPMMMGGVMAEQRMRGRGGL